MMVLAVHKLFWKIFLSFWLTLIIFTGVLMFAASSYLEHIRTQQDIGSVRSRLSDYLEQARAVTQQKGVQGLREWLEHLDRSEAIPIFLIDEKGQDLLEREIPPDIIARMERRREYAGRTERKRPRHAEPILLADGSAYRMVPDFQSITLLRILQRPRVIALPITIAALISILACMLLSRYLTLPLERLRRATQHIAAGDLAQRVGPSMGRRQDEIADLAGAFDKMAERLERAFNAQRQLLSDASHELRSPLARLQVALELARQRSRDDAEEELGRIELEIERLNGLIGQLLEFSRLEAGVDAAHVQRVEMQELLEGVVADAQFEAESKGCKVSLCESFEAIIDGNAMLLRSAIENVVRNAARYTKPGTAVEISMRKEAEKPGGILIQVRDHGPGVPEEMLPHLFEPFVRVEAARDRSSGGHGLGLAIADRAIRLYGGSIAAKNERDGGLSVLIYLPLAKA
jgi:two-component system sensor histidine kinase CpxA